MSQTLVQNNLHIVFSTKERALWFKEENVLHQLHAYLATACRNHECVAYRVGGVADHVHILCGLSKNVALRDLMQTIKIESSKWLKREFKGFNDFGWQDGYGAFSISPAHLEPTMRYIVEQAEHHRQVGFQDEFLRLCQLYGVKYDEKYLWN